MDQPYRKYDPPGSVERVLLTVAVVAFGIVFYGAYAYGLGGLVVSAGRLVGAW